MKTFSIILLSTLTVMLNICVFGCTGGLEIVFGDIEGPDSAKENYTAEFKISITGGTNISFLWMVVPPDAGEFESPAANKSIFRAFEVQSDRPVEIKVVITTDQHGPIVKTKSFTILNRTGWAITWPYERLDIADMTTDNSGNIYITGSFDGIVDFDLGPGVNVITSLYESSCFIAKYNSISNLIWAFKVDAALGKRGNKIIVNEAGSKCHLVIHTATNEQVPDTLAEYDGSGSLIWYRNIVGETESIARDSLGNLYLTGSFYGKLDFDSGPGIDEHIAIGVHDIFLSKFDIYGEYCWTKTWGGEDLNFGTFWLIDTAVDLCIDNFGDVYVAGCFCQSGIDFDPGPGTDIHNSNGGYEIFISKFNSYGEFIWARTFGSEDQYDTVSCITTDGRENVYVAGNCEGKTDYDPSPAMLERPNGGPFMSCFNIDGGLKWVDIWDAYISRGDITFKNSNIYMTGVFYDAVDFDPGPDIDFKQPCAQLNSYLMQLGPAGKYNWAHTWGCSDSIWMGRLSIDNQGNLYIQGSYKGIIDFDPGPGEDIKTAVGGINCFLLKLNLDGEY